MVVVVIVGVSFDFRRAVDLLSKVIVAVADPLPDGSDIASCENKGRLLATQIAAVHGTPVFSRIERIEI
jgi:hypothetical protein